VLPGELITADVVDFLTASAEAPHGYVRGAIDPDMKVLRVVRT
jgi:arginine decarboxylase